jgi:hypothetical protein
MADKTSSRTSLKIKRPVRPPELPVLLPPELEEVEDPVALAPESVLPPEPPPPVVDYTPKSKDWAPDIAAARAQGDKSRLIANIGRATGMLAAAGARTKPDLSAYDNLEQEAALPEQRVHQDMALEKLAQAAMKDRELKDPASRVNRQSQDVLLRVAPGISANLGGEAAIRSMTKPQIDAILGLEDKRMEFKRKTNADESDVEARARQMTETERHNKAMEARPVGSMLALTQERVQSRADQNNLIKLAKETSKFSQLAEGLDQIEGVLTRSIAGKKSPLDVKTRAALALPGGSHLVERMPRGKEAIALDKAQRDFQDLLTRLRTGAVINEQEEIQYNRLFESGILGNPEAGAQAIKQIRDKIQAQLRDMQIGFEAGPNPVLEQFEGLGGTTYRSPMFVPPKGKSSAPVPKGTAPATGSTGGGMVRVRYPKDPSGKVYVIPADKVGKDGSVPVGGQ